MDPEELELMEANDSSDLTGILVMAGAALVIGIGSFLFGKRCGRKASSCNPGDSPVQVRKDHPAEEKASDEKASDDAPIGGSTVD